MRVQVLERILSLVDGRSPIAITGFDEDKFLAVLNNWTEVQAKRENIVTSTEFVEHAVAEEIMTVAEHTLETCTIGVVWGPARIGKSFTLKHMEGSPKLFYPILIRAGVTCRTPSQFARQLSAKIGISRGGSLDVLGRRLFDTLRDLERMVMIDEVDQMTQEGLEFIREMYDESGCAVFMAGKPVIYERLGYREVGTYREVTDQFAGRVGFRRDLTERTRDCEGKPPRKAQKLYRREDIQALITMIGVRQD